jgi:hypothetical protein
MAPILLLFSSNVFMTFAWYGHLRFKSQPLALVIFVSWLIAFFEYCLAVPANRWKFPQRPSSRRSRGDQLWCSPFGLYLKEPLGPNRSSLRSSRRAFFFFSGDLSGYLGHRGALHS